MPIDPIKVGISGGIGSGKTTVCKIFNLLGIPVYYADQRARTLMTEDSVIINLIVKLFGENAYLVGGELNRAFLAHTVFDDEKMLKSLNRIVHPAVAHDFKNWIILNHKSPYVIKEAALLVESGSYKSLDYLVTVSAPVKLRIQRVLVRDSHRSRQDINYIISRQLDEKESIKKSQFEIVNDNNTLIIPQVLNVHEKLINAAQAG